MNWTQLIKDLLERGHTYRTIGEAAGMTSENIRALERNVRQQPRWPAGQAIIALHKRAMRKRNV